MTLAGAAEAEAAEGEAEAEAAEAAAAEAEAEAGYGGDGLEDAWGAEEEQMHALPRTAPLHTQQCVDCLPVDFSYQDCRM